MKCSIIGAVAHINLNYEMMKQAGIQWLRHGISYPFEKDGDTLRPTYIRQKQEAQILVDAGFKLMGSVLSIGSYRYSEKAGGTVWVSGMPESIGGYNDKSYYIAAQKAAEFVGRDCKGLIDYWQISNEPDIETFHGDMPDDKIELFLATCARGLKKGNPEAQTGTNLADINPLALKLAKNLCSVENAPFDFIGIDGYMGSWQHGGPETWIERIDLLYDVAKKPIIINEWGYSTLQSGPDPDPENKRRYNQSVCKNKNWGIRWQEKDHSPELQADYIMRCMKIFSEHPAVLGEFFFRWSDTKTCWQCGDPLCPAECAWGIMDTEGNPKPGYFALKKAYETYFKDK